MPQHSLTVGGQQYDVDFPYAPYDCQLTMMEKVLESLATGRNALLESPTGTVCAAIYAVVFSSGSPRAVTSDRGYLSAPENERCFARTGRGSPPSDATPSFVPPFARRYRQDALLAVRGARVARGARASGRRKPPRRSERRDETRAGGIAGGRDRRARGRLRGGPETRRGRRRRRSRRRRDERSRPRWRWARTRRRARSFA